MKYKGDWPGAKGDIYVYKYNETIIWGVTAEIIYHFVQQLKREYLK